MLTFLIVCPLVFLAGFVDAIAGGGGLISLPAYMIAGLPTHTAVATNKLSSSMGTTVATYHYLKQGYMKWIICIPGIITSLIGSFIGARINLLVSDHALKNFMLIILPFTAFYVLKNKNLEKGTDIELPKRTLVMLCCLISFGVGMYDGLYGPGTGTFLMILFTGICHLSLNDAAGTTKVINLTTNYTSLVVYLISGNVLLPLGLAAGACNMIGNYIGSHAFSKKGATFIRPLIMLVLVVFFFKVIYDLVMA